MRDRLLRRLGLLAAAFVCHLLSTTAAHAATPEEMPPPLAAAVAVTTTAYLPWVGSDAQQPLDVITRPDAGRAVSKSIPPSGGSITATGADGDAFTLTLPPGALAVTTTVTLTPIAALTGAPYPLAAAVQIGPDLLALRTAATLRIVPAPAVPVPDEVTFAWYGPGHDFHLYPVTLDTTRLEFVVTQLHGYGVGRTPAAAAQATDSDGTHATPTWTPRAQLARLMQEMQQWIRQERMRQFLGEPADPDFNPKMATLLRQYYDVTLKPLIPAIETDCAIYEQRLPDLLAWVKNAEMLGLAEQFAAEVAEVEATRRTGLANCYREAASPCMDWSDDVQVTLVNAYYRELLLLGWQEDVPHPSELPACAAIEVLLSEGVFQHTLEPDATTGWVRSFRYQFPDDTVSGVGVFFPPALEPYASARMLVNEQWVELVDFPDHNFYCRDRADERMSEFVVSIYAPDTITETIRPRLIADNIGCWRWQGSYTASKEYAVSTEAADYTSTETFETYGVLFERPEAQRNIQPFAFNPDTGALVVSLASYAPVLGEGTFDYTWQSHTVMHLDGKWCRVEAQVSDVVIAGTVQGLGARIPTAAPPASFDHRLIDVQAIMVNVPMPITRTGTTTVCGGDPYNVTYYQAHRTKVDASGKSMSGENNPSPQANPYMKMQWSLTALREP